MKGIAFAIVTATALAWGVSVQAAPNGTAGSLKGAERQASTQLIQHRHHPRPRTAVACATGAAGVSTATGCAGVGTASL